MPHKLITEKQRQLLTRSDFLKEADYSKMNSIYQIILNKNFEKESTNLIDYNWFIQSKTLWIFSCRKEWMRTPNKKPKKFDVINSGNCELCNHRLTATGYYVTNKKNGSELMIGSECLDEMLNPGGVRLTNRNDEETVRYFNLIDRHPELNEYLEYSGEINSGFILPNSILKKQQDLNKLVKKYIDTNILDKFIKNKKKQPKIILLLDIKSQFEALINAVQNFQAQAAGNELTHLTIGMSNLIQSGQKKNYDNIVGDVRNNEGLISTENAANINVYDYLVLYCKTVQSYLENITLKVAGYGGIIISYTLGPNMEVILPYNSSDVISCIGFPTENISANLLYESLRKFVIYDRIDKKSLDSFNNRFSVLVAREGYDVANFSNDGLRAFIDRKNDLETDSSSEVTYSERTIDKTLSNYNSYFSKDGEYYAIDDQELVPFVLDEYIESSNDDTINEWFNAHQKYSLEDVYNKMYLDLQLV